MKLSLTFLTATMAAVSSASPAGLGKRATPKVYMAGDSTMALNGGGSGTQGTQLASLPSLHKLILIRLGTIFPLLNQEHRGC